MPIATDIKIPIPKAAPVLSGHGLNYLGARISTNTAGVDDYAAGFAMVSTPAQEAPSVTDTAIAEDKELGYIITPNTTLTGLALTNLFDAPNPDFANTLLYSSLATYDSGQALAPPASDQYPLLSTAGFVWQVTSPGHSLLNGKGINAIKTINGQVYLMGSRTLSLVDLYNRIKNRQILSAYLRTMTSDLNQGIVLRELDSTSTQLAAVKTQMDRVSEAFYRAKLFDGVTYQNACSNLNNNIVNLQRRVARTESIALKLTK